MESTSELGLNQSNDNPVDHSSSEYNSDIDSDDNNDYDTSEECDDQTLQARVVNKKTKSKTSVPAVIKFTTTSGL